MRRKTSNVRGGSGTLVPMLRPVTFACLLGAFAMTSAPASPQEVPRPEFPQPQFERHDWLTLNGPWELEFDDQNVGLDEGWALTGAAGGRPARRFSRQITVPFACEWPMSGIGDTGFHPYVWYRRSVTMPAGWKGRRVLLKFGAVDYRAMVWVNGQMVGQHEGGQAPFAFDITPALTTGANTIVVRAEDPPTDRSIPRGKQFWEEKSRGIFYTRTTGIWQPVWLEAAGDSYLESRTYPPVKRWPRGVRRERETPAARRRGCGDRQVREHHRGVSRRARGRAARTAGDHRRRARSSGPCERPNLYDVTFEVRRGGTVLDRVQSYLRVSARSRAAGTRAAQRSRRLPEDGARPGLLAAVGHSRRRQTRRSSADIEATLAMGFNGARKHQKVEDPRYLYWADKMGFLVSARSATPTCSTSTMRIASRASGSRSSQRDTTTRP